MILEKCVECKKCLFSAIETTKNQGKTAHIISEKCLIKVLLLLSSNCK